MKFFDWLHWKKGRSQVPGEVQHIARVLLGELQGQMARSGVKTGSRTVTFPDGSSLTVAFLYGMAQVRFDPVGRRGKRTKRFRLRAYVTVYGEALPDGVSVLEMGTYVQNEDGTFTEEKFAMEVITFVNLLGGTQTDMVNITSSTDGKSVFVTSYYSADPSVDDRLFEIETETHTLVRTLSFGGGPAFADGNFCAAVTVGDVYVGSIGSSASNEAITVVGRDLGSTFPLAMIGAANVFEASVFDIAMSPDGRYCYAATNAGSFSPSGTSRIQVIRTADRTTVGYIDVWGIDEDDLPVQAFMESVEVSPNGRRLYVTADSSGVLIIGAFVARIDLTFDDDGNFVSGGVVAKICGGSPLRAVVSPDNKTLYVTERVNDWIWVYDTDLMPGMPNTVTDDGLSEIFTPGRSKILSYAQEAFLTQGGIALTPDGKKVLFPAGEKNTAEVENRLYVYDANTGTEFAYIDLPGYPVGITTILTPLDS